MYADTIGLPIYFVYSKEKYIKEPKKKQNEIGIPTLGIELGAFA